jgi:phosphomethylpyrimidine synthase
MKITDDIRQYAAENGMSENEAIADGMEQKSRQFVEQGGELYTKA